jgi:hypothetical protein
MQISNELIIRLEIEYNLYRRTRRRSERIKGMDLGQWVSCRHSMEDFVQKGRSDGGPDLLGRLTRFRVGGKV